MPYGDSWHDGRIVRHHNLISATQPNITGPINKGGGKSNTSGKGHGKGNGASAVSTLAVQDFGTGTSTGAQSFTTTALGGLTPKAAIVLGSYWQIGDTAERAPMNFSLSFIDGSSQAGITGYSGNAVASTNDRKQSSTASALVLGRSTIEKNASGSLTTNGISLNFSSNGVADMGCHFAAFAGNGVSAKVGTINLGTGTSAIDVTGVGFQPDVVLLISVDGTFSPTYTSANTKFMFGVCVNDGSATQRAVAFYEDDGQANGDANLALITDGAVTDHNPTTRAEQYTCTVSAFDADGFSITPSASAGGTVVGYLALKFADKSVALLDFTTPTSTGSSAITGAGFLPEFGIAVTTSLEATDTFPGATSAVQSSWGVSMIGNEQWATSWCVESGAATTNTSSERKNVAILCGNSTVNDDIEATLTSWDSDGLTLNYSAVNANAKKGFMLLVG